MGKTILNELTVECPFPHVFKLTEVIDNHSVPLAKIGHIRADFDGHKWWNTVWRVHKELETAAITKEIDKVYTRLTGKGALKDLATLRRFCEKHPEARAAAFDPTEYNFYYRGTHTDFWLRLITRERDYNLYLHAFVKEES